MSENKGGVRFIRVNGRVVPIRGKGSAPAGISKRYGTKRELPAPKQIGVGKGAAAGAVFGASLTAGLSRKIVGSGAKLSAIDQIKSLRPTLMYGKKAAFKAAAIGALAGAAIGSIKFFRKGKGESDKQLAARTSGKKTKSKLPKTGV